MGKAEDDLMRVPNDWPKYSADERARWLWHAVLCESRGDWVRTVAALLTRTGELEAALARLTEAGGRAAERLAEAGGGTPEPVLDALREAIAAARALTGGDLPTGQGGP
jgi:hypothetical protein